MIVVGVDGSRAGLEAVAWAATEARLRDVPLRVVNAMPRWACENVGGRYASVATWMREGATTVVTAGLERAHREEPGIVVDSALLPGDPRAALIAAAEEAELLVVGNHGLGRVRGMLVGSVAYGVAGHAPCDVVVVRQVPVSPLGEVVVGLDGVRTAESVLRFAFTEASLRGVRLRIVHARPGMDVSGFETAPHEPGDEKSDIERLREVLNGWRQRHQDVVVVDDIVKGHPAEVLKQAGERADLLVVGSRGRGGFAGLVLGSISQAMLHQAPCPLAIVRT
ncbi:universal stress protein [Nonomuraea africana]|uniref:universal stress protein n=1 Tax=Nonomuraea africana TaxID=46171 RepID=UPI0033FBA553